MKLLSSVANARRGAFVAAKVLPMALLWLAFAPAAWAIAGVGPLPSKALFPRTAIPKEPSAALKPSTNEPVSIEADAMGYDKDTQIAVAIGHVTVVQGSYVMNADKLVYDQKSDTVEAIGNVSVLQPTGDVYFSDHAVLSDNMKHGVAYAFKARLSDNSVMASREARKVSESVTTLTDAVYSPCRLCDDAAPFWQIKASRVRMDQRSEQIEYEDAQIDMFGIPTIYSPYLRQPTPKATAKSGFLPATYGTSVNLGASVRIPYYWRISPDKDLTVTPWIFSDENPLLQGEYRQLTDHGDYNMHFTATEPQRRDNAGNVVSGTEFRGNVTAKGTEKLSDYSRVGFDINRTSDDTYLRRYGLGYDSVLFSTLYAETAQQRNMASIQAIGIQGLRVGDDPKTTPLVAPTIDGYYETKPLDNGMRFHVSGNAQSLTREIGSNQRRISLTGGATYPYVMDNGQVFNAAANLRQDLYDLDHVPVEGKPTLFNGTATRTIPQAALQWRYPWIRLQGGDAVTIEPLVLAVAQPDGGNPPEITNEDSKLLELNDTNLFDIDRVPGYDVVDSGDRMAYGFRTEYLLEGGEAIDGLLGQNYSFSSATPYPNSTSPGKNSSDIIGRVGFHLPPLDVAYRFALNDRDLSAHRNQLSVSFTKPWLTLNTAYNSVNDNQYLPNSRQLDINGKVPLTDEWSLYASGSRDLELDRMINAGGGLIYHNECFDLTLDGLRSYTRDRDVGRDTRFTFRVGFKNLGVFGG